MNDTTTSLDVGRVLAIVASRWKTVLAVTIVAGMAAYGYVTFLADEVFEATALVTYQAPDRQSNPTNGALPSTGITREDIGTLVANATNRTVVEAAAAKVGIEPQELRRAVQVRPHGDASIVAFAAKAGESDLAASYANAWAEAFVAERAGKAKASLDVLVNQRRQAVQAFPKNLSQEDARLTSRTMAEDELREANAQRQTWLGALNVSNEAQAPEQAVWPRETLTMVAALVIGLAMGSGLALLTARVDNRLHGDEFDELPAPVLVRVPASPRAPKNSPLGPATAEPIVADSFAALGARVMLDRHGDGAHTILVTSARSGEGKSTVAANLASSLALGGRRVVLVDADMRRPTQDIVFPMLQNRPGLSQVLTRGAELEAALTLVAPNLAAVASGPRHANASMLLASVAFRQVLDRLAQISEVIVIDAPPVLAVNDALAIAPAADQVLLAARVGTSDLNEISEAHTRLGSSASTPQAMVLVGTERPQGYGYDHELRPNGRVAMPHPAPQAGAGGSGLAAAGGIASTALTPPPPPPSQHQQQPGAQPGGASGAVA